MAEKKSIIDLMEQREEEGELNPLTVTFELTHACNLRCGHCYLEHRHERGELSTAQWRSFIDQAVDLGAYFGGFTGGEILCRGDFLEIARYAARRGMFFFLLTNGTLIDEAMASEIQDLQPTKVEISLYGATAEVHDKITRVPGSFHKTVKAIGLLRGLGIQVTVKTTVMAGNWRQIPAIRKIANDFESFFSADPVIVPGVFGSEGPASYRMDDADYRQYMISEGWGRNPGKEVDDLVTDSSRPDHRVLCTAAKKRFTISARADVIPCVMWRYGCGSMLKQSLAEIWSGSAMTELRRLQFRDLTRCVNCEKYSSCVRCAGLAYMDTGDYRGCPEECRRMSTLLGEIKRENREKEASSRQ